jgi:hypothetical protein
MEHEVI